MTYLKMTLERPGNWKQDFIDFESVLNSFPKSFLVDQGAMVPINSTHSCDILGFEALRKYDS